MELQTPRGTKDIYGEAAIRWQKLEGLARDLCARNGMGEIRTPMFEHTELFVRGVGEGTDVVQKEMYTFTDKGGRSMTLRPEMTAGVARAFIEHNLGQQTLPQRFYYIGPNFRYEKPAGGRQRQFHQFGAELYGSAEPAADAEMISLAYEFLKGAGLGNATLSINSLGGPECRAKANAALLEFLKNSYDQLCPVCQERSAKNPMRALDCKEKSCQAILADAPSPIDFLGEECKKHFDDLKTILDAMKIPYTIDPKLVRGLDYYTRTVFEFIDPGSGLAVCGGGRYDGLIEEVGGSSTPAVGFAMGLERIIQMLEQEGQPPQANETDIFVGSMGPEGYIKSQALANSLRKAGIRAISDLAKRGVKAQIRYADKIGARFSVIIGDSEIQSNQASIKEMKTGAKEDVGLDSLGEYLIGKIKA
ncbi:MAG: histidine--tRNA ligase [Clostridiales bacterium]|jgi:histidyl-tRNA synthetase|nr:histidine--tRNA ligase [Clostridiales bacterium]